MAWIVRHTPCLLCWWLTQKMFPSSSVLDRNAKLFSIKDLEVLKDTHGYQLLNKFINNCIGLEIVFDIINNKVSGAPFVQWWCWNEHWQMAIHRCLSKFHHPNHHMMWMCPWTLWSTRLSFLKCMKHMAIVGYIVGLGDRHSKNIQIDQATAELCTLILVLPLSKG
ncbi:alpha/beta-Hydrolases superfamily protein [Artemisia annua]|uniref:Alpha/beta-Hydrolases superfamily protein n=1 Tax=Artemisia annua TaxID=35608 RepID=A0A2U1MP74_ARTAN|nr:alpha/beta-Hydrolases superfamily protein [Artemisia annua]